MNIIAIDMLPQRCFLDPIYGGEGIPSAARVVPELNKNAVFAESRILLQAQPMLQDGGDTRNPFKRHVDLMAASELMPGLPMESRYNKVFSVDCMAGVNQSLCFHDVAETRSTGLIEWLHEQQPETLLIGGLALDRNLYKTVQHLRLFGDWEVVVNLAACRGYQAEASLAVITAMRAAGITVIANTMELLPRLLPVSHCPAVAEITRPERLKLMAAPFAA